MINRSELSALAGEAKHFAAEDSSNGLTRHLNQHTPAEERLSLKVGAQVMLLKNLRVSAGLVNGARGLVAGFSGAGYPLVRFAAAKLTEEVRPERWTVRGAHGGGAGAFRQQLPLKLAWAFSIHKAQGMTLDCVEVNLANVFECGQAYVALSRARSLEAARIVNFRRECISADPKVIKFYRDLAAIKPIKM